MKSFTTSLVIVLVLNLCASQIIKFPLKFSSQGEDNPLNHNGNMRSLATDNYYVESIQNLNKAQYYGDLKLGTQTPKVYSVIFDTYTSLSWIPNPTCIQNNACNGFTQSFTCSFSVGTSCTLTDKADTWNYLSGKVSGNYMQVPISVAGLDPISSAMLSANSVTNLSVLKSDGVFGLGMYNSINSEGNSFVMNLFKKGQIQSPSFSIYLGFKKADSQITFGGFDTSTISNLNTLYYHNVVLNNAKDETQKWQVSAKKISIGSFTKDLTAGMAYSASILSYISFSSDIYNQIITFLKLNHKMSLSGNNYRVQCNEKMPDLQITLPDSTNVDRVYTITPSYYINNQTTYCEVLISDNGNSKTNSIFLGDVFLRRYVSIYHQSNSTIGFAESVADPDDDYTKFPTWAIAVVCVGIILLIAVGGFFLFKKWKQRKNQRNLNNQLANNNQNVSANNNNYSQQDFTINSANLNQQNYYPPQQYQQNYPPNQNH